MSGIKVTICLVFSAFELNTPIYLSPGGALSQSNIGISLMKNFLTSTSCGTKSNKGLNIRTEI